MLDALAPQTPATMPTAPEAAFDPQRLMRHRLAGNPGLTYFLYRARRPDPRLPLFVAVHGIQRQAREQAELFAPLVEARGGTLVAPLFGRRHFKGYQRLGRQGKGARADLALRHLLAEVAPRTGLDTRRIVLFGYSGGGQFAHRFAMAYPRQVLRMAVAAPGWFTLPDQGKTFPDGIGPSSGLPGLVFDPARFLEIPTLVLVGDRDIERDAAFNRDGLLDARLGRTRVERGRRWAAAMAAEAARYNYATPYVFDTLPGCGHSFAECMTVGGMGRIVVDFLYPRGAFSAGEPAAAPRPPSTLKPGDRT